MFYSACIQELFDLIAKKYSPRETIELANRIAKEIRTSPIKFIVDLENARYDYAMDINNVMNLCPYCGNDDEPYIENYYTDDDADGNRGRYASRKTCPECGREY